MRSMMTAWKWHKPNRMFLTLTSLNSNSSLSNEAKARYKLDQDLRHTMTWLKSVRDDEKKNRMDAKHTEISTRRLETARDDSVTPAT